MDSIYSCVVYTVLDKVPDKLSQALDQTDHTTQLA